MIAALLSAALALQAPPCDPSLICEVENGEDLERVEGTPWIIASSVNGAGLFRLDARTGTASVIAVDVPENPPISMANSHCPGRLTPGAFAGHGIAVRQGPRPQLFAVNHARGTIEIFDIAPADARLTWRGCVRTPPDMAANGIVPLPGGALAATKYATPGQDFTKSMAAGTPTGDVRLWLPGHGWSTVAGSAASVANGIAASNDGKRLFVAVTGTREIWRITLRGRSTASIDRARLDFSPDNLRWDSKGHLLTAGFNGAAADAAACFARPDCILGWSAAAIDPDTLKTRLLASCPGTSAFGNATTAIEVDHEIWLGTFRGDAIARIHRPDTGSTPGQPTCLTH